MIRADHLDETDSRIKSFFNYYKDLGLDMPYNMVNNYLLKYRPYATGEYNEFFLDELLILQQKEMIDISLGLDVLTREFYSKTSPKTGVSRHHVDRDRPYYCVFYIDQLDNDFKVKLIPIIASEHMSIHNQYKTYGKFYTYHYFNDLAKARISHLYEIIQRPYKRGDEKALMTEFKNRIDCVCGNDLNIWSDFFKDSFGRSQLNEWVKRWVDKKTMKDISRSGKKLSAEELWYSKYHPGFYYSTYRPYLEDMRLYQSNNPNCKRPAFWDWFFRVYLRENIYPIKY